MPFLIQPLTAATADPNAATAAAAVFKRHESSSPLSAAAAAAALRARPTTPTRVADVQTKRTLRRSASVASSSRTASPIIQGRPNLQRRGSSGSMTERTFRSPSPHRQTQSVSYDAPPVPALPKDIGASPKTQHQKSKSLGMGTTPVRLASQRLGSEDAPSWFGAARVGDPANIRRTDPAMASPPSSPPQIPQQEHEAVSEIQRPDSQASSINFSYPKRTRVGSPPVSPTEGSISVGSPARFSLSASPAEVRSPAQMSRAKEQPARQRLVASPRTRSASNPSSDEILVYDPNSRRMVPRSDLYPAQYEAPQQRTNSKRRKKTPQKAGSYLAAGTVSRAKSTVSTSPPVVKNQVQITPAQVEERISAPQFPVHVQEDPEEPAVKAIISSPRLDAKRLEQHGPPQITSPATQVTKDAGWQGVRRQPSVVKEEPEPEESGHNHSSKNYLIHALDSVPTRQNTVGSFNPEAKASSISQTLDAVPTRQKVYPNTDFGVPSVEISKPASPSPVRDTRSPVDARRVHVAHERSLSNSPVRQAHFGPVQENLTVKHSPPPRSISPRKSALKHSSPSRGASPSSSDASVSANHELPIRKKSVRVSFDDSQDVISTSPEVRSMSPLSASSPETNRQRWFSLVNKDIPSLDDDEIMKPRPALPSFGSVRERKPRETRLEEDVERPLVRPNTDTYSSTGSATTALLPSPSLGSSNDHALGGIFSQEYDERRTHAANTSRLREPLPPVVTSVEGSGYISDTDSDSSLATTQSEYEQAETSIHDFAPQEPPKTQPGYSNGSAGPQNATPTAQQPFSDPAPKPEVPQVSVIQPTPPAMAEDKSLREVFFDVPGGFPEDESDPSVPQQDAAGNTEDVQNLPPIQPSPKIIPLTGQDTSTDSESSIYSDAYEDLSDMEGNGFLSLDAVVERPLQPDSSSHQTPQEAQPVFKPAAAAPNLQTEMSTATTAVESPPAESPQDEWEKAKAYWRSLSAEKRTQLEKEAQEEAGVEADLDQVQSEPKPKKKKSIERRNSERKALALHMAQQMAAQQQREQETVALNRERSYMIKPGTKWTEEEVAIPTTMRRTLRTDPQQQVASTQGPRLRKSLRSSSTDTRRSDTRPADTSPARRSVPSAAAAASSTSTESQRRAAAALPTNSVPTALGRRDSNGSESSFKRSRPRSEAGAGFRMSMRPNSPPTDRSSKRFSITSLSSKQSVEASAPTTQMRRTLRDSSTEGRKSPTGMRMPSFVGKKGAAKVTKSKATGKFSSRFADSSDEDGGVCGFQSRFGDSSDDDVAPTPLLLPKSKSAPNAVGGGRGHQHSGSIASSALLEELEESEESLDAKANGTTKPDISSPAAQPALAVDTSLRRVRSGRGSILPTSQTAPVLGADPAPPVSGAASPDGKRATRRNSLMSVLRRKKHDSSSGGISRSSATDSPARRDTKLERNAKQLRATRDEDISPIVEEPPAVEAQPEPEPAVAQTPPHQRSPKLQKRMGIFGHGHSHSVQQPPLMKMQMPLDEDGEPRRPSTSGNLGTRTLSSGSGNIGTGLMQHQLQQRPAFSTGAPSVDGSSVTGTADGGTPKKKRFRGLRRMFRLDE
ncbi:hypothetical protein QBC40DRAFT_280306 [Triangularia verruculosa]|uniref:Uncharacterized protein n=1 Tax=Triangularia verruculosa TaxID=2587418 RepID=A0AAN6XHI8_9PEZI|nr:hypothetical protein QBC40DRAFT_280306 [Triangularia verruculosa]